MLPLHHRAGSGGKRSHRSEVNGATESQWSQRRESNLQPPVYKTGALPLSYAGKKLDEVAAWAAPTRKQCERTIKERRPSAGANAVTGGSPGTRTPNLLIKSQLLYH